MEVITDAMWCLSYLTDGKDEHIAQVLSEGLEGESCLSFGALPAGGQCWEEGDRRGTHDAVGLGND